MISSHQHFRNNSPCLWILTLFKTLTMAINQEKFFIEAINILCSSLDVRLTMDRFWHLIKKHMPVNRLSLGMIEPEFKRIRHIIVTTEEGTEWANESFPASEKAHAFLKTAVQSGPIIIDDMRSHEALGSIMGTMPSHIDAPDDDALSILALPLMIEGKIIGNLGLNCWGAKQYTREHADLLAPLQEPLALILTNSLHHREVMRLQEILAEENRFLYKELSGSSDHVIGKDFGLKQVMESVSQAASRDVPILLLGETGTGKEVIANVIHSFSGRRKGPFIKVNCGAIPDNLIDSELFGHEKGAFTGAFEQKKGKFERANQGTIFLDEIGELPLAVQVRLLRVIQNKEIERVGGTETIALNIRIIAATHRDLEEMFANGDFREDLFYRLNVFPIEIPPLRQRKVDLPELVDHFIEKKSKELKLKAVPTIAPGTINQLIAYDWPGNVRELENLVERALIRYRSGELSLDDFITPKLQTPLKPTPAMSEEILPFDDMARQHILRAIKKTDGRISGSNGAAALLRLQRGTLRGKMKKLGIE